ncbi:MAG: hypothetical protein HYX79_09115 [Chloroflexi bacterium]|nr:hypothetical protein [Chloroflexota bacterium]
MSIMSFPAKAGNLLYALLTLRSRIKYGTSFAEGDSFAGGSVIGSTESYSMLQSSWQISAGQMHRSARGGCHPFFCAIMIANAN